MLVTLAVAMNDLALVHVRLDEDEDDPDEPFYWNRLAISPFTEAALFFEQAAEIEQVSAFVESLPSAACRLGSDRQHCLRALCSDDDLGAD